jgi:hypothetical protein
MFRLYLWGALGLAFLALAGTAYVQSKRVANLKQENALFEAQVQALEDARKRDNEIANALNTFREQQRADIKAFDQTLRNSKVTREVKYESGTCVVRDPALYRRLFDQAVGENPGP